MADLIPADPSQAPARPLRFTKEWIAGQFPAESGQYCVVYQGKVRRAGYTAPMRRWAIDAPAGGRIWTDIPLRWLAVTLWLYDSHGGAMASTRRAQVDDRSVR